MKKVARLKSLFNKGFSPFFSKTKKTLIFFKKSVDIYLKSGYYIEADSRRQQKIRNVL